MKRFGYFLCIACCFCSFQLNSQNTTAKLDTIAAYEPSKELQVFANEIEKIGWIPDTTRLQKVGIYGHLTRERKKEFSGKPFYKTPYEATSINYAESLSKDYDKETFKTLDFKLFKSAKSVWNYFYRKKDAKHMISDGLITQWEFSNAEDTEKAFQQISSVRLFIYVNTMPYLCRKGNYVYVFHTRAMAFSYDQKKVFKQFVTTHINN